MKQCCGTCKWHKQDPNFKEDWLCVNADSKYCADWTNYNDKCEEWEQR